MLILASASLARRRLLKQAGISHHVMVSGVNEAEYECSSPSTLVESLALAKVNAVELKLLHGEELSKVEGISAILGCDSVFVFEDEVFAKPRDAQQAIERWEKMSSKSGFLMTGYALKFRNSFSGENKKNLFDGLIQDVITTHVEFASITSEEINNYVSTGEPLNCAGGFALEGRGGMLISKIEGCYSNVIGLSLPWLRCALKKSGV